MENKKNVKKLIKGYQQKTCTWSGCVNISKHHQPGSFIELYVISTIKNLIVLYQITLIPEIKYEN